MEKYPNTDILDAWINQPIDYATYVPVSMPKFILDVYLKAPVEKREEMLLLWLKSQGDE